MAQGNNLNKRKNAEFSAQNSYKSQISISNHDNKIVKSNGKFCQESIKAINNLTNTFFVNHHVFCLNLDSETAADWFNSEDFRMGGPSFYFLQYNPIHLCFQK